MIKGISDQISLSMIECQPRMSLSRPKVCPTLRVLGSDGCVPGFSTWGASESQEAGVPTRPRSVGFGLLQYMVIQLNLRDSDLDSRVK